jgi:integrase
VLSRSETRAPARTSFLLPGFFCLSLELLAKVSKKKLLKHHPALPYKELASFIEKLQAQEGFAARALEFTILTAARTGEVINAKPEEIKDGVWTIPAERMKAHKEHRVPLSRRALKIVESMPEGKYIFPGPKGPLSNMAMLETLRRMGHKNLTVHGFRSTFKDWAAEETNFPNIVSEMALAHTISSDVEAAYRRGELFEKRKKLMQQWAIYCETKHGGNVLPMQKKA